MKEIIYQLKSLANSESELSLNYESSPEEAVIIGTKEGYINAAVKLLEIASHSGEAELGIDVLEGNEVNCSNHIKFAFNELGDVWPIAAYLVESIEQQRIVESIFSENGNA